MKLEMLAVEKLHTKSLVAAGGAMNDTACFNAIIWKNQRRQKSIEGARLMVMMPEQTNYPLLSTNFLNKANTLSNKVWGNRNAAESKQCAIRRLCVVLCVFIDCIIYFMSMQIV